MATVPADLAQNPPAGPPPPGVIPNYSNPPTKGPIFYYVGSILLFIMIVMFSTRMFVKFRIVKRRTWDDVTCSIAAVGTTLFFVAFVLAISRGKVGRHNWDVPVAHLYTHDFTIPTYLTDAPATPIWYFIKLTFFLLYLQIFKPLRWFRYCTYAGIGIITAGYLAFSIVQFYLTTPAPSETWAESLQQPRFAKEFDVSIPVTAFGLAIDICIFVLPITGASGLNLSNQRKLGVMAIFATGLGAVIASMITLIYKVRLYRNNNKDFMYLSFMITTCSFVEMCVGVTITCMPSLSLLARNSASKSIWSSVFRRGHSQTSFKNSTRSPLKNTYAYEKREYLNLHGTQSEKSVTTSPDDIELGQLQTSFAGDSQGVLPQGGILRTCEMHQWSEQQ